MQEVSLFYSGVVGLFSVVIITILYVNKNSKEKLNKAKTMALCLLLRQELFIDSLLDHSLEFPELSACSAFVFTSVTLFIGVVCFVIRVIRLALFGNTGETLYSLIITDGNNDGSEGLQPEQRRLLDGAADDSEDDAVDDNADTERQNQRPGEDPENNSSNRDGDADKEAASLDDFTHENENVNTNNSANATKTVQVKADVHATDDVSTNDTNLNVPNASDCSNDAARATVDVQRERVTYTSDPSAAGATDENEDNENLVTEEHLDTHTDGDIEVEQD